MAVEKKIYKGRQKIDIKKMEDESRLLVTFSKRRSGLFKKASEICTLCGVEVAIIVFSPHQKVYTFGHPNVDIVIERFLTQNPQMMDSAAGSSSLTSADINLTRILDLNKELTGHLNLMQEEKNKGKLLDLKIMPKFWWENAIQELNLKQLEELKAGLELLKQNAFTEAYKLTMEAGKHDPFLELNSLGAALPKYNDNNNDPTEFDPNDQNFF